MTDPYSLKLLRRKFPERQGNGMFTLSKLAEDLLETNLCTENIHESTYDVIVLQDLRLDGRKLLEARKLKLNFGSNWGCCMASLGQTKVVANVSCDVQQPKLSRPNEGMIHINVEFNPLVARQFESTEQSEIGVMMTGQLERCFKDSKCVDLESLCIVADKKVWNIRVDVNVINHDGNLVDCASIATLAALSHFHRPDVTSTGDGIIIHPFNEKDPLPLTLFHHPVCVSFATFEKRVSQNMMFQGSNVHEMTETNLVNKLCSNA
ncbi:hypothetical protein PV326_003510 [Microctonus aethiopoides]|nr:hypothetical protein PV326_003510 [Microctonus aethiopoides]